jgi:anion-transporting  ArsA/GET3 family ATPase
MSELPLELKNSRIVFVTGKGGVGKSVTAAALAYQLSEEGRNVLLVELGFDSFYKSFFNLEKVDISPTSLKPNLSVARWDTETCLQEYVMHYLPSAALYKLFFKNNLMRALINVAPPLKELTLLGKITSGVRKVGPELNYDVVVIDSFATGQMLALLRAPRGIGDVIKMGPMGEQSREIYRVVTDPKLTQFCVVTLADELPVAETEELFETLKSEMGITARILCNRLLRSPIAKEGLERLIGVEQAPLALKDFCRYVLTIQTRQDRSLARLRKVGAVAEVPLLTQHMKGLEIAAEISKNLSW